jgi:hypothetical protein
MRNIIFAYIPRLTKALQRTTTLTLPGSLAAMGGGWAIIIYGSDARSEGAEAVVCIAEYIRRSNTSSNSWYRFWKSCRDLSMYSRCIDAIAVRMRLTLYPFGANVNSALPWKVRRH